MKSLLASIALTLVFVLIPAWSNILANVALTTELNPPSKINLLSRALIGCDQEILQRIGDLGAAEHFYTVSVWAYEKATICFPQQATFHFVLGEALFAIQRNGFSEFEKAIALEPNNPIFRVEYGRVRALFKAP